MKTSILRATFILMLLLISVSACSQTKSLIDYLLFYSAFDGQSSADLAKGDATIYTARSYKETSEARAGLHDPNIIIAKGKGLFGDALHFKASKTAAVFYKAYQNVAYNTESWSGTISFWLRLDPNKELPPHYCDPIVVTDMQWNDAALWVDFTDHNPRQFRFGAIGDKAAWNANDEAPDSEWIKRTIEVNPAPFNTDNWTHVALVFSKVNTKAEAEFKLYLNGALQGTIANVNNNPFTWEPTQSKIMLGLGYIGFMDELAILNKALSSEEIRTVAKLKKGIASLFKK